MKNENELIPCDDELNRLKIFLADFKKPTLRYTGTDFFIIGLGSDSGPAQKPECARCGTLRHDLAEALCPTCQEEEDYDWL